MSDGIRSGVNWMRLNDSDRRLETKRVVTEVVRVRGYDPQVDRFLVEPWPSEAIVQEGATV